MYVWSSLIAAYQPGEVANPACGQLNRQNEYFPARIGAPEDLVSRDGFGRSVPRHPLILHTQAESVRFNT